MTRALLVLLLSLVALAPGAAAQDVSTRPQDQIVVAQNERDGSSLFEFAFEVRRVTDEVVDPQNAAIAYASCQACTTVALSVQIIIVSGSPDTVTPENLALALNEECQSCTTFASAQQFVVGGGGKVKLTGRGKRELKEISRRFRELEGLDLTPDELAARVEALGRDIRRVLADELRVKQKGKDDDEDDEDRDREDERDQGEDDEDLDEPGTVTTPVEPYDPDAVEDGSPAPTQTTTQPQGTTPTQTSPGSTTTTTPAQTTPAPASTQTTETP